MKLVVLVTSINKKFIREKSRLRCYTEKKQLTNKLLEAEQNRVSVMDSLHCQK